MPDHKVTAEIVVHMSSNETLSIHLREELKLAQDITQGLRDHGWEVDLLVSTTEVNVL